MVELLKNLLTYAILAPSTHNTQPWRFSVGENSVTFFLDPARILPASDPHAREAYVSLGHSVENFCVALAAHGLSGAVSFVEVLPAQPHKETKPFAVCTVRVMRANEESQQQLFGAITKRRSARVPFEPPTIDVGQVCASLNTEQGISYFFATSDRHKKIIADAVHDGTIHAFNNPAFGKELSHWITPNWNTGLVGMPGYTVGMPGPVSYLAPKVLARVNMGKLQGRLMHKVMLTTPIIAVVCGEIENEHAWMAAGRMSERLQLACVAAGLATSVLAAAVEFDDIATRMAYGLHMSGRPLSVFRVGVTHKDIPSSPRLSVEQCLL